MKRTIISSLLFVSLLFGSDLYGQLIPEDYDTLKISQELIVKGNVDYYGTAIQNDMLSKFIQARTISQVIDGLHWKLAKSTQ